MSVEVVGDTWSGPLSLKPSGDRQGWGLRRGPRKRAGDRLAEADGMNPGRATRFLGTAEKAAGPSPRTSGAGVHFLRGGGAASAARTWSAVAGSLPGGPAGSA